MRHALSILALPCSLGLAGCANQRSLSVSAPAQDDVTGAVKASPASVVLGDRLEDVETRLNGYALLERIALASDRGRIDYLVVHAEGDIAGPALVFENGVLTAIVGEPMRRTFAACRTLASANGAHWTHAGIERFRGLLQSQQQRAQLSPPDLDKPMHRQVVDTTKRGIGAVQEVGDLVPGNLLSVASSPTQIPKAVGQLCSTVKDQNRALTRFEALKTFPLGMEEKVLVAALGVDWARVEKDEPLLWYRKEGFEVLIRNGVVAAVEYPARYARTQTGTGGYYEPGIDWSRCPR
jgi:hypothetical protein